MWEGSLQNFPSVRKIWIAHRIVKSITTSYCWYIGDSWNSSAYIYMIIIIIVYAMKSIHKSTYIRWNISFKSLTVIQCLYFIVLCVVLTRTVVLSLYNEILLNGSHYTVVKHDYKWKSFDDLHINSSIFTNASKINSLAHFSYWSL